RVAADVAFALQRVQVILHGGAGSESNRLANFADGGWVAADLLTEPKVLQDFPLPAGQRFWHVVPSLVRRCRRRRPGADHLAPSAGLIGAHGEGRGGVLRPRSQHRSTAICARTSVDLTDGRAIR